VVRTSAREDVYARVDGREIRLTNLDKVLWPDEGYVKADLVDYYAGVAPFMVPHLRDRPRVCTRYPDGIDGQWFYQKDRPDYAPEWVRAHPYETADGRTVMFCLCDGAAELIWFANQAAVEIHPWFSRTGDVDSPDVAVFDLDPAEPAGFDDARDVAFLLKEALDRLGLHSYPKTSGATGLHVYVPVRPERDYEVVREFVRAVGEMLRRAWPDRVTQERVVKKRSGKVYIDHLQMVRGKTVCAPYSARPLPGAPVSMPIEWGELDVVDPRDFTIKTVPARLESTGDLLEPVLRERASLDEPIDRLRRAGFFKDHAR